jgi:predicted RNase H-like HicB family nuclease
MLRYHVAFYLPQLPGEMVVAEALDFPGAVTQGFDLPDARLMIASALEDLAQALLEDGKPLPLRRSRELTHPCSYRVSQGVREIWNGGHHPRREACWCCFVACGEGAVSSTPKACGYRLLER